LKFYISGPISGLSEEVYTDNFGRAEAFLLNEGYDCVNPLKVPACFSEDCRRPDSNPGGQSKADGSYLHDWTCYMKHDIISMMECNAILLIPGWAVSRGARIELRLAEDLEYEVYSLSEDYRSMRKFIKRF
jgi:hypothetical protein